MYLLLLLGRALFQYLLYTGFSSLHLVRADLPIHCEEPDVTGIWDIYVGGKTDPVTCGYPAPNTVRDVLLLERTRDTRQLKTKTMPDTDSNVKVNEEDGYAYSFSTRLAHGGKLNLLMSESESVKTTTQTVPHGETKSSVPHGDNSQADRWSLVFDEGLELNLPDKGSFFAFFKFKPYANSSSADIDAIRPNDYYGEADNGIVLDFQSNCDKTVVGWAHMLEGGKGKPICWYGVRRSDPAEQKRDGAVVSFLRTSKTAKPVKRVRYLGSSTVTEQSEKAIASAIVASVEDGDHVAHAHGGVGVHVAKSSFLRASGKSYTFPPSKFVLSSGKPTKLAGFPVPAGLIPDAPAKRKHREYPDYLRNGKGKTKMTKMRVAKNRMKKFARFPVPAGSIVEPSEDENDENGEEFKSNSLKKGSASQFEKGDPYLASAAIVDALEFGKSIPLDRYPGDAERNQIEFGKRNMDSKRQSNIRSIDKLNGDGQEKSATKTMSIMEWERELPPFFDWHDPALPGLGPSSYIASFEQRRSRRGDANVEEDEEIEDSDADKTSSSEGEGGEGTDKHGSGETDTDAEKYDSAEDSSPVQTTPTENAAAGLLALPLAPVQNQGNCGSCYALAAVFSIESRFRVALRRELGIDVPLRLSAEAVFSCSPLLQACNGGFPLLVGRHSKTFGLRTEDCAPLRDGDQRDTGFASYGQCLAGLVGENGGDRSEIGNTNKCLVAGGTSGGSSSSKMGTPSKNIASSSSSNANTASRGGTKVVSPFATATGSGNGGTKVVSPFAAGNDRKTTNSFLHEEVVEENQENEASTERMKMNSDVTSKLHHELSSEVRSKQLHQQIQTLSLDASNRAASSLLSQFPVPLTDDDAKRMGDEDEQHNGNDGNGNADNTPALHHSIFSQLSYYVKDYGYVGGYYGGCTADAMMREIFGRGPLSVAAEVPASLGNYVLGSVYDPTSEIPADHIHYAKESKSDAKDKQITWQSTTHAMAAVGYGTHQETGEKYWVLRNSWGPDFGNHGYFLYKRGTNAGGIEHQAVWFEPDMDRLKEDLKGVLGITGSEDDGSMTGDGVGSDETLSRAVRKIVKGM